MLEKWAAITVKRVDRPLILNEMRSLGSFVNSIGVSSLVKTKNREQVKLKREC
jgi:hypothetical protein